MHSNKKSNPYIFFQNPNLWPFIFFTVCALGVLFCKYSFCAEAGNYRVRFEGIKEKDKDLLSLIRGLSRTLEMSERPAGSASILRKRISEDIDLFYRLLKSEGYFDAKIQGKIDTKKRPWIVIFDFDLSAPFNLASVSVRFTRDAPEDIRVPDISKTGMKIKQAYSSKDILEGQKKLLFLVRKQGFPHPVIKKREIIADHKSRTVTVSFIIDPGHKAWFGNTVFKGLKSVDQSFLRGYIPWKEGEKFDPDLLTRCYKNLMDLGLFSTVKITEGEKHEGKRFPVEIDVTERKPSSVSAGFSYGTDVGPGIQFSWENRDLFGHGEKLGFQYNPSNIITTVEGTFKKPAFLVHKQSLRFTVNKSHETPDAYTSDSLTGSVIIDREFSDKLDASLGVSFKTSKIDQIGVVNTYSLLSMPVYLKLDNSDSLLDPTTGGRLAIELTPFYELSGDSLFFNKAVINYRHYLKLNDDPRFVLAGSITIGMIKGADRDEVPADERFYAGGGGSVRGYSYQSIGPLSGTTPLGGKSLLEMSFESRLRLTDKFGLVTFLDGGSAFSGKILGSGEKLRWGTGLGIRYYTLIGPLRFDIGIPMNRREGIDAPFQIYISIGQAF